MEEGIRVQVIDGNVCLVVFAHGKESVLQLSLSGAEHMADLLVRAVRYVEGVEFGRLGLQH